MAPPTVLAASYAAITTLNVIPRTVSGGAEPQER